MSISNLIPSLTSYTSIETLIENIVTYLFGMIGTVTFVFMLIAGIKYMTASSEQQTDEAKASLVSTVIGLVVISIAFAIISYIRSLLPLNSGI